MKITKRDIRRLTEGDIPVIFTKTPFVLIKSNVTLLLSSTATTRWEIAVSRDEKDSVEIDSKTARAIIEKNQMELAYHSRDGRIYELPHRPFYEAHNRHTQTIAS